MPEIYSWNEWEIISFILILMRVSAFMVAWPIFYVSSVPLQVKVFLSVALSLILFPLVNKTGYSATSGEAYLIWMTIKEVFIGFSLGYFARFFFYIFNIAGDIISTSMGLSGIQLFNPAFGGKSSALEQFLAVIAILFFLSIKGHHLLLMGLADSFRLVGVYVAGVNISGFELGIPLLQEVTVMGLKICAPVLASILFMNLALAIVGRAVPQLNVLITSLPVNILIGFVVLIAALPFLLFSMDTFLEHTSTRLFQLIRTY